MPAAALEDVFREHHVMVFRAALRITGSAEDAEDVLQNRVCVWRAGRTIIGYRASPRIPAARGGQRGVRSAAVAAKDALDSARRRRSRSCRMTPCRRSAPCTPARCAIGCGEPWPGSVPWRTSVCLAVLRGQRESRDCADPGNFAGGRIGDFESGERPCRKEYQAYWRKS